VGVPPLFGEADEVVGVPPLAINRRGGGSPTTCEKSTRWWESHHLRKVDEGGGSPTTCEKSTGWWESHHLREVDGVVGVPPVDEVLEGPTLQNHR
jgi:hypothetical protein